MAKIKKIKSPTQLDGEEFINKLIEYGLGVKERTVYEVDKAFFDKV